MSFIRVKKAFTLIELMIVIVLVSVSYFVFFSNSTFKVNDKKTKLSINNIKSFLLENYDFKNEVSLVCIEEKFDCYVQIDGTINNERKFENLFKTKPENYEYNTEQILIEYDKVNIDNINLDVIFKYTINSDYKTNDFILDTLEGKVYMFNSLFAKPSIYEDISMAFEQFNLNTLEVKDAF